MLNPYCTKFALAFSEFIKEQLEIQKMTKEEWWTKAGYCKAVATRILAGKRFLTTEDRLHILKSLKFTEEGLERTFAGGRLASLGLMSHLQQVEAGLNKLQAKMAQGKDLTVHYDEVYRDLELLQDTIEELSRVSRKRKLASKQIFL